MAVISLKGATRQWFGACVKGSHRRRHQRPMTAWEESSYQRQLNDPKVVLARWISERLDADVREAVEDRGEIRLTLGGDVTVDELQRLTGARLLRSKGYPLRFLRMAANTYEVGDRGYDGEPTSSTYAHLVMYFG